MLSHFMRTVVLLAIALATVGCGAAKDPHGRLPLSGTILLQGKPLDAGTIEFLPSDPKRSGARTIIRAGKYQVPREQGVPPGTYRVLISSPEPSKSAEPVGPPGHKLPPLGQERIPLKYNRDSRETVEVKADAENRFDFTIQ
jgi:hypothetical protein